MRVVSADHERPRGDEGARRASTQLMTSEDEIEALAPAWEALMRRCAVTDVRLHPDWLRLEARAARGRERMVVASRRDGALIGVAAFLVEPHLWCARLGYATAMSFPVKRALFCGAAMAATDPEAHEALLDAVLSAPDPCDVVSFESVPVTSDLLRAIRGSRAARACWVHERPPTLRRLIRMPATLAEYMSKFSGRTRRTLLYKARKLGQASSRGLTLERVTRREHVPRFLEHAERVSSRSWQGARLGHLVHRERHEDRLAGHADRGWLRSYVLLSGDEPIALVSGTQANGVYTYEHAAYDRSWAPHHPGTVLLHRIIEDLFARDPPLLFDFGYGDNEYKRVFSNDAYDEVSLSLVRKSPYTAVALATDRACIALGNAARAALDRLGLRERVRGALRGSAAPPEDPDAGAEHDATHVKIAK